MKKILLFTDNPEKNQRLVDDCKKIFPECDVIILSETGKTTSETRAKYPIGLNLLELGEMMIGISPKIEKIRQQIKRAAGNKINTIIFGENGVGKESVAQALYGAASTNGQRFIKISCESLSLELKEGIFSGLNQSDLSPARKKHILLESNGPDTIYINEIDKLSTTLQTELIHLIESDKSRSASCGNKSGTKPWIICSFNSSIADDKKMNIILGILKKTSKIEKIYIPPLRERPEDILPLVSHYMDKHPSRSNGKRPVPLSRHERERLVEYPWPGNVKELINSVNSMMISERTDEVVEGGWGDAKQQNFH